MTGCGFDETCSSEQLSGIGNEALGETAGGVEERCRTAWVDVVLFCNALCDGASGDDGDCVVGCAYID